MKKILGLIALASLLMFPSMASAGIGAVNYPIVFFTSPSTLADIYSSLCDDGNLALNKNTNVYYKLADCAGSGSATQFWPPLGSVVVQDTTHRLVTDTQVGSWNGKLDTPTGTGSQYLDGTGTPTNFTSTARTFTYPSRALNSCFQISATNDAEFHYNVDVTAALSLVSGQTGTVAATSYTNSGCSAGAQLLTSKQNSNTGTLSIGVSTSQLVTLSVDGMLPAGKWVKIATAQTTGTPSFAIGSAQQEVILP